MELDITQNKIIRCKPFGLTMVKGSEGSGKTTSAIFRLLHLKNNYCLYDDDGILMVNCKNKNKEKLIDEYNNIENESKFEYISLFSNNRSTISIKNFTELGNFYFNRFCSEAGKNLSIIKDINQKVHILKQCMGELKKDYKKMKFLKDEFCYFFLQEISWIKACNYITLNQYQRAERTGRRVKKGDGPQRLLKNSIKREIIYGIFEKYNEKLKDLNMVDDEDVDLIVLNEIKSKPNHLYTHVIIDGCENLSRVQLEILHSLCHNRVYSSTMFFLNQNLCASPNAWIIKGRKLADLGFKLNGRSFVLKKKYNATAPEFNNMEKFTYLDLRYAKKFKFMVDNSKRSEVILELGEKEELLGDEEVKELPVFSGIAAGEPMLINSEVETNITLPNYWLKGVKECFVLRVKGDSMIGAQIEQDDLVVIRKQNDAVNRDIVAVEIDGCATLKRLKIDKNKVELIPENSKYEPISLEGKNAMILGLAIGVIKSRV